MSLKVNNQAVASALAVALPAAPMGERASPAVATVVTRTSAGVAGATLTLHIERLMLPGYSRNEANRLVQGLEQGLQQLLAQQPWPAQAQQLPRLLLPAVNWRATERPEQRGQRLALLLAQGLGG